MDIFLRVLLLIAGFIILTKGADFFVDSASKIAQKSGIPSIVIGLTIVAFGTSLPEAAISISAGLKGSADLAISNITGSNILNVMLILGISAVITSLAVQRNTVRYEIPFVVIISAVLLFLGWQGGELTKWDGAILWLFLLIFAGYLYKVTSSGNIENGDDELELTEKDTYPRLFLLLLFSGAAIIIGSDFTVDAATYIAKTLGLSENIIGLTIVAFGTSLPELITSVTAARKNMADIAIGNIVGSNICNILFVLGSTALLSPVPLVYDMGTNFFDNLMDIGAMLILWLGVARTGKLEIKAGIFMLLIFVAYYTYVCCRELGVFFA